MLMEILVSFYMKQDLIMPDKVSGVEAILINLFYVEMIFSNTADVFGLKCAWSNWSQHNVPNVCFQSLHACNDDSYHGKDTTTILCLRYVIVEQEYMVFNNQLILLDSLLH